MEATADKAKEVALGNKEEEGTAADDRPPEQARTSKSSTKHLSLVIVTLIWPFCPYAIRVSSSLWIRIHSGPDSVIDLEIISWGFQDSPL